MTQPIHDRRADAASGATRRGATRTIGAADLALRAAEGHILFRNAAIGTMRAAGEAMRSRQRETSLATAGGTFAMNFADC